MNKNPKKRFEVLLILLSLFQNYILFDFILDRGL